jgi:hypothetical protein
MLLLEVRVLLLMLVMGFEVLLLLKTRVVVVLL